MAGEHEDLYTMTMSELVDEAHRVGIPFVAHMSISELIEAIGQQRETNALAAQEALPTPQPPRPRESQEQLSPRRPASAS